MINLPKIKIGFFADGPWAHGAFDNLLSDPTIKVDFVCARHDAPDEELRERCLKNNTEFFTHENVNSDEFFKQIEGYESDIFVSMSFNQIFKARLLNYPRLKTINCHAGKLPFYRGRNVLNWVLINGEREFGITTHYVDNGIDTGDIILQDVIEITDDDSYQTLLEKAYLGCESNLYNAIKLIQKGAVEPVKQSDICQFGFYCTKRGVGDEVIVWDQSSIDIYNFIRALCRPGPVATTYLDEMEIKINRIKYFANLPQHKGIVGAVVGVDDSGFFVKTKDSFIKVLEWSGYDRPRIGDRLG